MNTKTLTILLSATLFAHGNMVFAADVTGDRAIIGSNHLLTDSAGSITGGWSNTNQAGASIVGGGIWNVILTNSSYSVISGGRSNSIGTNSAFASINGGNECYIGPNSGFGWIGGGALNEIEGTGLGYSSIGGGILNLLIGGAGVIGGGFDNAIDEDSHYSVIGGGRWNYFGTNGNDCFIGGGLVNVIAAGAGDGTACSLVGGQGNLISTNVMHGFIGGGVANVLKTNSVRSVIGGGSENAISAKAFGCGILAGRLNEAGGTNSIAGGYRAKALSNGCFVWGDSSDADIASTGANQFIVRAKGGIWVGTNSSPTFNATNLIDTSSGAALTIGGTWVNNSDREAKENFRPINIDEVLERLSKLKLQSWNYKAEGDSVRHVGPMAQDFFATFGLGVDDKHIGTLDSDGVAFAAIQALHRRVQEKEGQITMLERELKDLKDRTTAQAAVIDVYATKLMQLEKTVQRLSTEEHVVTASLQK